MKMIECDDDGMDGCVYVCGCVMWATIADKRESENECITKI